MKYLIVYVSLVFCSAASAQIPVSDVRIACSSEFFKENDYQHALIVRGMWCQDVYFWSIINIADTLDQLAYYQDNLFTGECVDYNVNDQLIGRYTFEKGLLVHLQEYDTTGIQLRDFNFDGGIPHKTHTTYNEQGKVNTLLTFDHGVLNGSFIRTRDYYDFGLGECVETGRYENGIEQLESKPCSVDSDN
jgi:hypothetical protein